jgi:hypothetical protein
MSIGPSPSLGGGLAVQDCPTHCPDLCDPKYLPACSNDCYEPRKCCSGGDGDGGGGGGGGGDVCPTVCPDTCDPKYLPRCSNDCQEQMSSCSCSSGGSGTGSNPWGPKVNGLDQGMMAPAPAPPASITPCSPPDGTAPVLVPDSTSPYSGTVTINPFSFASLTGLRVTCVETGVTLVYDCGFVTFFHNDNIGNKTYTCPGGRATNCPPGMGTGNWGSGSVSAPVGVNAFLTLPPA